MRERWRPIARVEKAHGRRGELVAVPVDDLPAIVREGLAVAVVPPPLRGPRRLRVSSCSPPEARGQRVRLEGVDDLGVAASLVGRTLLARERDLPDGWESRDARHLVGRTVVDRRLGTLGVIEDVMRGAASDVLVVRGARGEVLVPAVEGVVSGLPGTGPVEAEVPVGLAPWDRGEARA